MPFIFDNYFYHYLDRNEDCFQYEGLGEWTEMVQSVTGERLYRTWNFYDPSTSEEVYMNYPKYWKQYFCRPQHYPQTAVGMSLTLFFF